MTAEESAPENFEPIYKHSGDSPNKPRISIRKGHSMSILSACYSELGEPEAVRFFIDGNQVAIVPTDKGHPHAYSVTTNNNGTGATMSALWLKNELEMGEFPEHGHYIPEFEDGMAIVDFGKEPVKKFD